MKILAVLAVTLLSTNAVSYFDLVNEEWTAFKMQYNKQYSSETEESFRKKIFMENSHMIAKHNQLYEEDLVSYKLKLNKWGDMLHFEFVQNLNGFNATLKAESAVANLTVPATFIPPANVDLPDSVDWRNEGAVTPIKDQGQCGSCWSFAATGAIEGQHFRKSKALVSLSEENLVDCSGSFGNLGCFGGSFVFAFNYVISNRGIATEESYPYKAKQSTCVYNLNMSGATVASYSIIAQNSEADLQSAVATVGPIAVAIDAGHSSFQFYSEGVYYEPQCSATALDHGVLVVGYGTDTDGDDYWLVKNSWGTTWGDQGYIKMSRNRGNNCGIATQASYPLV